MAEDLCSRSESLQALLFQYFQNKPEGELFKIDDIEDFVVLETPFKKSARTDALKKLEVRG